MVSYFASNNSDSDLADACNRPPGPHVTVIADSPDECRFIVDLRINETLQTGAVENRTYRPR